jgi:dimethylaniline monooxygenase (N-oxide forming)
MVFGVPWRTAPYVLFRFIAIYIFLTMPQFKALGIPENSPLRNSHSLFWTARTSDEGSTSPYRFHGLVQAGKIKLIAPKRVERFGADGHSVVLSDGVRVEADAVIVATGFKSSWGKLFDRKSYTSSYLTLRSDGLCQVTP